MKPSVLLCRYLPWLNLPLGLLMALLQRTPALRVLAGNGENMPATRVGELLRAALTLASLGATHSLAGATTFVQSPGNPVRGTVGTRLDVAFTYTGTPSSPARFQVSGSLPPGLSFVPAPVGGTIGSGTPAITGIPTEAGSFSVSVQGFNPEGLTNNVQQVIAFEISGGLVNAVPVITVQPQSQTATAGASVSFSVQATGTPAPAYQWTRDGSSLAGATAATLTLNNVQPGNAGTYAVHATNAAGSVTSASVTLAVISAGAGPGITVQPSAQHIAAGGTVVFNVGATGAEGFQWRHNGVALAGADGATLVLGAVALSQQGTYTVVVNGGGGSVISQPAVLGVLNGPDFARLVNLSILSRVSTEEPFFTLGTVIGGAGTGGNKPLLVRAAGPALAQLGVTGALPDPRLEIYSGDTPVATNDDWGGTAALASAFAQVGAFGYGAATSKDAASFNPATAAGAYTIRVGGSGGATGPVIAELYDASSSAAAGVGMPRLVNVSVLKQIDAGESLTAGFVIGGGVSGKTVLIRAVGPTLGIAPFNVAGAMADPKLELFSGSNLIAANDNWGGDARLTAVGNSVGAFGLGSPASRDALLLVTLAPGSYTARVSGEGGGGTALVEVYEVP